VRKDEFLATLAHELRNPLAPIRTGLQLLKLAPRADVAARTLPVMERQLGQLVRLIDDLLDVSRISSGKIVLKRERIAFQDIAAAALEASRPLIDVAGHSLTIDWPDEPVWLDADPTRLAQIFSNLLTNSAKYMRPGGQIRFSARRQDENVLISVLDTGMGIPADMLGLVFDMFTQINRTLDRSQGGLGIGLSLVKTLVEMHGGSVQAASGGIDLGSEFTVSLPTASEPEPPAPSAQPVAAAVAGGVGHRILVVDDNVDAAETMVMLLDLSGHEARSAFGGQEALDMALAFRPDLVFLDIGLPGMNGYEVARRLLAEPGTASTKLIALTGWGTEEDIRKSKIAGFHAHLTKPVDPDAVEAMLTTFLPAREAV
jgi:CheY-like chemotaxis protein/two-component sensor histidine kinase